MNEVDSWLESGAGVPEGLRLLSQYAPSPRLERLVAAAPERFRYLLIRALSKFASPAGSSSGGPGTDSDISSSGRKFRDEWPFLSDARCPVELKILAADKITAWNNFRNLHEQLFACATPAACFEIAKNLLKNFEENRQITAEFAYFKEHHRVLGRHKVFKKTDRLSKYKAMSVVALLKEEKRLIASIWRDESELKKGDRPHLDETRRIRLEDKRAELAYVRTLIADFEKASARK